MTTDTYRPCEAEISNREAFHGFLWLVRTVTYFGCNAFVAFALVVTIWMAMKDSVRHDCLSDVRLCQYKTEWYAKQDHMLFIPGWHQSPPWFEKDFKLPAKATAMQPQIGSWPSAIVEVQ